MDHLTEGVGFEPTRCCHQRLSRAPHKPLGHPSHETRDPSTRITVALLGIEPRLS